MSSLQKMSEFLARASAQPGGISTQEGTRNALSSLFDMDSFVCLDQKVVSRPFSQTFDRPPDE